MELKGIELYLTNICNRNCIYCFGKNSKRVQTNEKFITFETALQTLITNRKKGYNLVSFLGGEPTLHPEFSKIARIAKKLGYYVSLYTNGLKFADEKFVKMVKTDIDLVFLNIPHHKKEKFEFLTGLKNSYEKLLLAIENLNVNKIPLCFIFIVTRLNYKDIKEYIDFFYPKGLRIVRIQYLTYYGNASINRDIIKVKISQTIKIIKRISKYLEEKGGYPFLYEHLQPCFLKNTPDLILDLEFHKDENKCLHIGTSDEYIANVKFKDYIKPDKCQNCFYHQSCFGISKDYLKIYGDCEFVPVIKKPKIIKCLNEFETIRDYISNNNIKK